MRKPLLILLLTTGIALDAAAEIKPQNSRYASENQRENQSFPREPLSKEQVLDLFQRLFALPAADHVDFDQAVKAGRIPEDLRVFREQLLTSDFSETPAEETIDLPFVELPDGSRVYPIILETLSPEIRAHITQDDLNALLPEVSSLQKEILKHQQTKEQIPVSTDLDFRSVQIPRENLAITLASFEPGTGTTEIPTSTEPDAQLFHFHMPPFLDGRHVTGARITQVPFTSIHLQLTEEGMDILAETTEKHTGSLFGILLNGEFHAAVMIGGRMETRYLQLPRRMTESEAAAVIEAWSK